MWESMGWSFGQKLRLLRLRHKLTQAELAHRLRLASHAHVSNLENGRFEPSLDVILAVANLFDVPLAYWLRETIPSDAAEDPSVQRPKQAVLSMATFGANLARLRTTAGLTQTQLADQLGLTSHAHISFLESGSKQPSVALILRIADRFAIDADLLFEST